MRDSPSPPYNRSNCSLGPMIYLEHQPGLPLGRFVDRFWYCQGYQPVHRFERVMPSGCASLIIALANDWISAPDPRDPQRIVRQAPSIAVGPNDVYETIVTADLARMVGVHFRPGGIRSFFSLPTSLLSADAVPLEALWRRGADRLRTRLFEAAEPPAMFAVLEEELLCRLAPTREASAIDQAVRLLGRAQSEWTDSEAIPEILRRTGLGEKRIATQFREHVGLTPKRFFRIRRFREALSLACETRQQRWAEIAANCGYYDQPHFIRDFQAFSGMSPAAYFEERGAWGGHRPVEEAG